MNRSDANAVVTLVWQGQRQKDPMYTDACRLLGINPSDVDRLGREAKRVERDFPRGFILTPTSVGRRSR